MVLNRRDLIKLAAISLAPNFGLLPRTALSEPQTRATKKPTLLGLTTLNEQRAEQSSLFWFDLETGTETFTPLADYRFGHSLEPLHHGRWLAIPYGDDDVACLVLDHKGVIERRIEAPPGMGFGGHGAVFDDGRHVLLHFNHSYREQRAGIVAIVDTDSGKTVKQQNTSILHAHDIIPLQNGQIVIADDGVIEKEDGALLFEAIQPALYYFEKNLTLSRKVDLKINGSVVHLAEDGNETVIGAVEQYLMRSSEGHAFFKATFDAPSEPYFTQFDKELFPEDVPLPSTIVSVNRQGSFSNLASQFNHQDPFDMTYNPIAGVTACVFTASNLLALKRDSESQWHYIDTLQMNIDSPFGLTSLEASPLIAINGFDRGIGIIDANRLAPINQFDVPTRGVKHLSYSNLGQAGGALS
ncbi:MAG: DUF1513 domain-containing protein [Pseudomonadales bacterium]